MLVNSQETQELLDRARKGDGNAVEQLLGQFRESLRRMIALRLDPALTARLDASDVVQDVLVEASRRMDDYLHSSTMPFHLWLRHIAKDHVIDAHRKHRKAQRRSIDREQSLVPRGLAENSSIDLMGQILDQEMTPASAAIRQELEQRLAQAIGKLEEDDREIILMRLYEQLSNQEIATLYGLSEPAAAMRYLRAVRRLQTYLAPS
ncbi:MAG TPA: sigma-70 family RNA polymerase sigma factor [Gemmataceae bacterium]|jgi:RNA polymerase sigma-70 factor (ECF subfamily)|nr:sigma-70 family RNA polymerase sigma factor [Gemmataceae bacterium]